MDVMMRLKGAGFSAIANAFREREKKLGGGLPLLDFVEIVLPGLPRPKTVEEKAASVSALIDLFEDIDINGDGVMEFEEFTSFCVDAGMLHETKCPRSNIDMNATLNIF
ncbi:LOW QUALITY PROTEIN: Hypothetical protein PHPALM_1098 [Phytophthora palmivora]|uniref:EF-hand domain-containing protein n=1 Tax=Phytophthora palmivora TaxID=4796 RepID=A0A2P4YT73_9STRA|nr:LOW QUALITY PROTEIN: Hypothetical protein PHPALM_1098 [Phytophthora palmivora]